MKVTLALAAAAAVLGTAALCSANLIVNPSFETTDLGAGSFQIVAPGENTVAGWDVGGAGVVLVGTYGHPAAIDGKQSVELSVFAAGNISQKVAGTVANQLYRIDFLMAGQDDQGPITKTMEVFWGGTSLGLITWTNLIPPYAPVLTPWEHHTLYASANLNDAELKFVSLVDQDGGPYIDAVSVEPVVPETSLAGLLAPAAAMLMARRRR